MIAKRTSVIVPALNEESTVGRVVEAIAADDPFEIIVLDSDSTDRTAQRAKQTGAHVVNWREVLPDIPTQPGKGEALWRGVAVARGEFVAFIDADLSQPRPGMLAKLVAPLSDSGTKLTKASATRVLGDKAAEGGRVTELTAKPLLRAFLPELATVKQPLGGEYALRRDLALDLPFVAGYGVEIGLLIDIYRRHGRSSIAEPHLGERKHRNRSLHELSAMADQVATTILSRMGIDTSARLIERPALRDVF